MDPQTESKLLAYVRHLGQGHEKIESQLKAVIKRYKALQTEHDDSKVAIDQLRDALAKANKRIRYIEDIPGKRIPYCFQLQIEIPGPTTPTTSILGQRLSNSQNVSQDGPLVVTAWASAFALKTFSLGPSVSRPNDPTAGSEVITPLTGRWRPVASTADPFSGAYIGAGTGIVNVAGAQVPQTFRPGIVDFLLDVQDAGVDRNRQNQISIPSRYLMTEFDRPFYLPVADFFERGSVITVGATFLRDVGFAEINYPELTGGFAEGDLIPAPDPSVAGPPGNGPGRCVVALGGTLYISMLGYKILQAQSPAV